MVNNKRDSTIHAAIGGYINCLKNHYELPGTIDKYNPWTMNVEPIIFQLVNNYGVQINSKNFYGETAFFLLCKSCFLRSSRPLCTLIEFGADVNICNNKNESGIEFLIRNVKPEMVKLILTVGGTLHNLKPDLLLRTVCEKSNFAPVSPILRFESFLDKQSHCERNKLGDILNILLTAGFRTDALKTAGTKQEQKYFEETVLNNLHDAILLYECGYRFSEQSLDQNPGNFSSDTRVVDFIATAQSLQSLTCCVIRQCLYPNAWVAVNKLKIPICLKELVILQHFTQPSKHVLIHS